jgi:hypothetical protein
MTTQVNFTESEQGQYIGTWTIESAPNDFLRELAAEAIRTGETAQARDDGCLVTASVEE